MCEICRRREYFREYKGFKMCIVCYRENITENEYAKETKITEWDKANLI